MRVSLYPLCVLSFIGFLSNQSSCYRCPVAQFSYRVCKHCTLCNMAHFVLLPSTQRRSFFNQLGPTRLRWFRLLITTSLCTFLFPSTALQRLTALFSLTAKKQLVHFLCHSHRLRFHNIFDLLLIQGTCGNFCNVLLRLLSFHSFMQLIINFLTYQAWLNLKI